MIRNLLILLLCTINLREVFAPPVEECETTDEVRLIEGLYPQLCNEVNGENQWNLFCGAFSSEESDVFCNVLGYPRSIESGGMTSTTKGDGQNKIRNLQCNGNETRILNCSHQETTANCRVARDVVCAPCNASAPCLAGVCTMNGVCECSQTCQNSGYCFLGNCICPTGFQGNDCTQCSPPCLNGGMCTANATCQCSVPFHGTMCELQDLTNTSTISTTLAVTQISLMIVVIIAVVPSALFCLSIIVLISCTIVVIIAVIIVRKKMKPNKKSRESINENTKTNSLQSEKRQVYELDDYSISNHHYYYVEAATNQGREREEKTGVYEIMDLYTDSDQKERKEQNDNTNMKNGDVESSIAKTDRNSTVYVVANINEL